LGGRENPGIPLFGRSSEQTCILNTCNVEINFMITFTIIYVVFHTTDNGLIKNSQFAGPPPREILQWRPGRDILRLCEFCEKGVAP